VPNKKNVVDNGTMCQIFPLKYSKTTRTMLYISLTISNVSNNG